MITSIILKTLILNRHSLHTLYAVVFRNSLAECRMCSATDNFFQKKVFWKIDFSIKPINISFDGNQKRDRRMIVKRKCLHAFTTLIYCDNYYIMYIIYTWFFFSRLWMMLTFPKKKKNRLSSIVTVSYYFCGSII